jgi:hypothetical protein
VASDAANKLMDALRASLPALPGKKFGGWRSPRPTIFPTTTRSTAR